MSIGTALLLGRQGSLAKDQLDFLNSSGIDVTRVELSSQALRIVERDGVNVVMVDLPTLDKLGVETFEAFRRIDPALPVILFEDDGEANGKPPIDEK